MPTATPRLDESKAYVFCPQCARNGNASVPLEREMHNLKCPFGHTFTGAQISASGAEMIKAIDIFREEPTITDMKWPIFINPKIKEAIETKFRGRVMITIGTLLSALADDTLVMITGEQGAKLRKMHIKSGAEMIAVAESVDQLQRERDEAIRQYNKVADILKVAAS